MILGWQAYMSDLRSNYISLSELPYEVRREWELMYKEWKEWQ